MKPPPAENWTPNPQQLAAYFDGELDDSPDFADLRQRLEAWLAHHPEAFDEQEAHQRMSRLWLDTTPVEPSADAWKNTLRRVEEEVSKRRTSQPIARRPWPWLGATACAVGFVLFFGLLFGALRLSQLKQEQEPLAVVVPQGKPKLTEPIEVIEVFAVATADDVLILRVEGEDTSALVVGRLPLDGPMELASTGEVRVVSLKPNEQIQMLPRPQDKSRCRPIIWARLETEDE